jgi:ABC-2 type transport system ATP-binding protein
MTAAALHSVTKRFGTRVALDRVSMTVEAGEVVSLLGPNGAGKTTALSILLGLRRPDDGRAELFGEDPRVPETRALVGVTPQEGGFPQTLRVGEVVDLVRAHYRRPAPRSELVERFGLGPIVRRQTGGLSGGERRKLAVALAFAGRPRAVFLDEPTAGLDVEARRATWREVAAFAAEGGTVVLTTHHLDEAEALAGRIVLLAGGRVVAEGSGSDLVTRAAADGLEDAFVELTEAVR